MHIQYEGQTARDVETNLLLFALADMVPPKVVDLVGFFARLHACAPTGGVCEQVYA